MKWIRYKICPAEGIFFEKEMGWNEVNEKTAKQEAYNGEYTIEDDGEPDFVPEPTVVELLSALLGVAE